MLLLAVLVSACTGVGERVEELRSGADEATERVQFCFAVTRALTAMDGGTTPDEAQVAAEEVLAKVPDELQADAQIVADRLRDAAERGDRQPLDEDFRDAAESLRDGTRQLCDPTR